MAASGSGPGVINVGGGSHIDFDNTQTVSNTIINLGYDGSSSNALVGDANVSGIQTLTLASSTTVNMGGVDQSVAADDTIINQGTINDNETSNGFSYIQGVSFDNQGVIEARAKDDRLEILTSNFSNSGAIDVANGARIRIGGVGVNFTNYDASTQTLTGGTYEVEADSVLDDYLLTAPVLVLNAVVILTGTGSRFEQYVINGGESADLEAGLSSIGASGELELLAGRNWKTANSTVTNNGVVRLEGGTITSSGPGASLVGASGSRLVGYGAINASAFNNSGVIEAQGGRLILQRSIAGAGISQIDDDSILTVMTGQSGSTRFNGANAALQLGQVSSFTATIGGFGLGDAIVLNGLNATAASVNASNQLVIVNGAHTVATLNLDGAYSGFAFVVVPVGGGTSIVSLPVPPTVAQYLALSSDYDLIPGGFTISDTAANIAAAIASLNDSQINAIVATSGVVAVTLSVFQTSGATLDKITGGFDVADTAFNIVGSLGLFNADSHIAALLANGGTATLSGGVGINVPAFALSNQGTGVTVSENLSYSGALNLGAGTKITVSGGDTLTETGSLTLNGTLTGSGSLTQSAGSETIGAGAALSTAAWTVNGATVNLGINLTYAGAFSAGAGDTLILNAANLTLKGATTLTNATTAGSGRLLTQGATTVSGGLTIGGTGGVTNSATFTQSGGNVTLGDAVAGDKATFSNLSTGVWNITDASGVALGANASSSITNQGMFEKTAGAVSTIAASFNNTGTVYAKAGIIAFAGPVTTMAGTLEGGAVQFTNGATSFATGASATVSQMSLSGTSSMTIAASLTYAGKFTQSTGTTLSINTGQILTLTGAATLNGVVHGAGELLTSGGTLAFGVGGPMAPGSWSSNNETITMTGSRGFAGTFTGGAGDVFNLNGGALTLTGATTLSGTTTAGTSLLTVAGATTISGGVAIGGTAGLVNKGAVSESGGNLTLGDAAGHKATLTNMAAHSWNLTDDSGVALGNASSGSTIANAGLFEKTGGTSTTGSAIAPGITNTRTIEAASGLLDLQGAIIGTGKDIVSGASTLEFGSTVASGQTTSFTGSGSFLELLDPQGFAGKLSGFDTVGSNDTLELSNSWTYTGFTENAGHTQGTMTFANGGQTASILFLGNYTSGLFQPTTNTSGTFVTYG